MRGLVSFPFDFSISEELRAVLEKASKKNPPLAKSVFKKIGQITQLNFSSTIDHFKNLKHGLSDYQRLHVGNFVLMFKGYKERNFILFDRLEHYDDVYSRYTRPPKSFRIADYGQQPKD